MQYFFRNNHVPEHRSLDLETKETNVFLRFKEEFHLIN